MPHDSALLAEVRAWLTKARKDLATVEYELQAEPPFADDIAFHSQQVVEKSLKAFLSWHRTPFRKTHNLVELRAVRSIRAWNRSFADQRRLRSTRGSSDILVILRKRRLKRRRRPLRQRVKFLKSC
jgi:HEPN domain-containing protein